MVSGASGEGEGVIAVAPSLSSPPVCDRMD